MKSHFNRPSASKQAISKLITTLKSNDAAERNKAQNHLIEIGEPAVPALIKLTTESESEFRREAASILGDICDPSAIPALISLLVDEAFEVRWRAAESLIKMKRESVIPLFQELEQRNRLDNIWFLDGIHHVLRKLNEEGYLGPPSQKVLEAFEDPVREVAVSEAAEKALEALRKLA